MDKAQIRIVSGRLRGRRLPVVVHPGLRPTPQMVREALFSILGNAVPDRPFFDVFAGSGVVGLEAVSRGAKSATFVERDRRLADALDAQIRSVRRRRRRAQWCGRTSIAGPTAGCATRTG